MPTTTSVEGQFDDSNYQLANSYAGGTTVANGVLTVHKAMDRLIAIKVTATGAGGSGRVIPSSFSRSSIATGIAPLRHPARLYASARTRSRNFTVSP